MVEKKHLIRDLSDSELRGICGGHPTEQEPFGSEPLLNAALSPDGTGALQLSAGFDTAIAGIRQGFVVHAPTCAGHPGFH